MTNVVIRFPEGKCKAVTLSYDDGRMEDKHLIEIMNKYGIKGTFNISTGMLAAEDAIDGKGVASRRQALEIYPESGHEIAAHGYIHSHLGRQPRDRVTDEILHDRKELERMFDVDVRGMAYPYGEYNDTVIECLKACGIVYARTTKATAGFALPQNWLELHPTCHHNDERLFDLAESFVSYDYGKDETEEVSMFYLWGHSYELENDNNWDRMEKFCEYIGGRDDIWYATNIEIYDYMQAAKQLRFNLAKTAAYNPTCTDIWFCAEGKPYKVPAGEKIKL